MADLAAEYGISLKPGDKWLGRCEADGAFGLRDRSRRTARSGRGRRYTLILNCKRGNRDDGLPAIVP